MPNNPLIWNNTSWLLNLLNLLNLSKSLIYRNDYLTFYIAIWIRENVVGICKRLYKSRKCGYFYYLLTKHKVSHLFGLFLQRIMKDLFISHPAVKTSWWGTLWNFSIFLVAGRIKLLVYLQICHWISKQVFYRTEMLFFVLIPSYTYVSRSMELNLCTWECYWCIRV